ncbi:SapC family protein [Caulobacter soli]|uniref:SapC family protein n=1 Tax=Caulobacter soli TaxID=2708539 RepID=UPI001FE940F5|nr:SapC family protein [Caulobacter soli]
MSEATPRPMPLFYREPQPLTPTAHAEVRLKDGDYGFAVETNAVSLSVIEFAAAMRHYPIVFSDGETLPVAVLGLGQGNRFVADGRWAEGVYVPAYVRRYPFVFIEAGGGALALGLDVASDRVVQDGEGQALFDGGKPTALTEGAMTFCGELHAAHVQTLAFVAALKAQDLLVPRQADAKLASGQPLTLGGFLVVDRERFAALPDAVVLNWHRQGWLALVHFHLASLDRFADLLARESGAAGSPTVADLSSDLAKTASKSTARSSKKA